MLTLRPEQIEVLRAAMRKSYEDRLIRHLTKLFPEAIKKMIDPDGQDKPLRQFIDAGIKKAESFNIRAERNVTLFIDLMVGISPDFFQQRDMTWVRNILRKETLTETEKMDLIFEQMKAKEKAAERKGS